MGRSIGLTAGQQGGGHGMEKSPFPANFKHFLTPLTWLFPFSQGLQPLWTFLFTAPQRLAWA
jgi:hypothetical protein